MPPARYQPGQRVRVTQQVPRLAGTTVTSIEGVVVGYTQSKTGSWFAHSKDRRLWLDRLELLTDDGELVVCNLDQYTRVERVGPSAQADEPPRPINRAAG